MSGPSQRRGAWDSSILKRAGLSLAVLTGVAALCLTLCASSQTAGVNQGGPDYIHAPAGMTPMPQHSGPGPLSTVDQMRRAERRRRLAEDTAKLVELSNQLKAEVDRTPEDQISVGVTKKATDIEKLARDVRSWQMY